MRFPGSNLLEDAFGAIDPAEVKYKKFMGRVLNNNGDWVTGYAESVDVEASVQAISRTAYKNMELDFQKSYFNLYACMNVNDIDRDQTGDQFIFPDGRIYQVESKTDWFGPDGDWFGETSWVGPILCVRVSPNVSLSP